MGFIEQINLHEENPHYFFLLLDTAKNHLYIKSWLNRLSKVEKNKIGNLFEQTIDETSPLEVSPLLIQITNESRGQLKKSLVVDDTIGMLSIIETSLSKQELIQHLQPFLQAELPNGELALFRFYDPSIVKMLGKMLDHESYELLLKPINNWWYQEFDDSFKNIMSI